MNIYYLREQRKGKGLTQKELADRVGITRQHYCSIENGNWKSLNFISAMKLCWILNISPLSLYSFFHIEKK